MTDNRWAVYSTEKGGDKVAKKTAKKPAKKSETKMPMSGKKMPMKKGC